MQEYVNEAPCSPAASGGQGVETKASKRHTDQTGETNDNLT
jgi:hypothetical protein